MRTESGDNDNERVHDAVAVPLCVSHRRHSPRENRRDVHDVTSRVGRACRRARLEHWSASPCSGPIVNPKCCGTRLSSVLPAPTTDW